MRKMSVTFVACLITAVLCITITAVCMFCFSDYTKLFVVGSIINSHFVSDDEITKQDLSDGAVRGMMESLNDPYSEYMSASEFSSFLDSLDNDYTGIGISVYLDPADGRMTIAEVFPTSPADNAGIVANDKILTADGIEIDAQNYDEILEKFKESGREITLNILRDNDTLVLTLTPDEIIVPTVTEKPFSDIYYIGLSMFGEKTAESFKAALENASGYKALVLDLRNNGGGLVTSLTEIADEILPSGLLFYTEDKSGNRDDVCIEDDEYFDKPLAVLINENSASASEILAGAIKDHSRGVLVGKTTFGKGLVQSTFTLYDKSAIKLTISKYFTPSGSFINEVGIAPDVCVENDGTITADPATDAQLNAAINLLK